MPKAKMTSKGRMTIPIDVRSPLGLRTGDEIEFVQDRSGFRIRKCVDASSFERYQDYLRDLAGCDPDDLVGEMRGE